MDDRKPGILARALAQKPDAARAGPLSGGEGRPFDLSRVFGDPEANFQQWYRTWADRAGLDPDPDNPLHMYDYRAAYRAGDRPEVDPGDGLYHWPSTWKSDSHPNRFVQGVDTKALDASGRKR